MHSSMPMFSSVVRSLWKAPEQTGLRERTEDLKASLNGTRASIAEAEAALAAVEDQLRQTPETIDLYVDDRAQQRVAQAELELRQLMAKYLPTSDPVKQKQTELNELRALQSANGGRASGGRRVGPNTTHQTLMENRNELVATADSLREREFTQQRQLNSADAKVRKLTQIKAAICGNGRGSAQRQLGAFCSFSSP